MALAWHSGGGDVRPGTRTMAVRAAPVKQEPAEAIQVIGLNAVGILFVQGKEDVMKSGSTRIRVG